MSPAYLHFALSLPQVRGEKPERPARAEKAGALIRIADMLAHPISALRFKAAA